MAKILVAMSGGVDSTVAAALLKQQGHEVVGVMLRLFDHREYGVEPPSKTCCSITDIEDARNAALKLGIPFHVFNYSAPFHKQVIQRFKTAYAQGRTPNPCLDCNRYIKFDALLGQATTMGFDGIATGHYAQTSYDDETGRYTLQKGLVPQKDQSYVLYTLTQAQLKHLWLPVGSLTKAETREIAASLGLLNANKPDSQDICFVPDGDYAAFLQREFGMAGTAGDFIDEHGTVLGTHKGILHYTVGQRRGLGVAASEKLYVKEIKAAENQVVLAGAAGLVCDNFTVLQPNWVSIAPPTGSLRAMVRTRYHQTESAATLFPQQDGSLSVQYETPQKRPAPGQAAVFYQGNVLLGGGEIA